MDGVPRTVAIAAARQIWTAATGDETSNGVHIVAAQPLNLTRAAENAEYDDYCVLIVATATPEHTPASFEFAVGEGDTQVVYDVPLMYQVEPRCQIQQQVKQAAPTAEEKDCDPLFPDPKERHRPVHPGLHILPRGGTGGTLGLMVKDGDVPCILSNTHVLAYASLTADPKAGDPIYQPNIGNRFRIARLRHFKPLAEGEPDCATATLSVDYCTKIPTETGPIKPTGIEEPKDGTRVEHAGAETGPTPGVIHASHANVGWFGRCKDRKDITTCERLADKNMILVRHKDANEDFTSDGDSGGVVINKKTRRVIGLVVGGNGKSSVVLPIKRALDALGVAVIT